MYVRTVSILLWSLRTPRQHQNPLHCHGGSPHKDFMSSKNLCSMTLSSKAISSMKSAGLVKYLLRLGLAGRSSSLVQYSIFFPYIWPPLFHSPVPVLNGPSILSTLAKRSDTKEFWKQYQRMASCLWCHDADASFIFSLTEGGPQLLHPLHQAIQVLSEQISSSTWFSIQDP